MHESVNTIPQNQPETPKPQEEKGTNSLENFPVRQLTIEDVEEIKQVCQALISKFRAPMSLSEHFLYDYFTHVTGERPESKEEVPKEEYGRLILSLWQKWKESLATLPPERIPDVPHLADFLKMISEMPDVSDINKLRGILNQFPDLNKIGPVQYQEAVPVGDEVSSGFLHIHMNIFNGYQYERPKSEIRIYLNPKVSAMPEAVRFIINVCQREKRPLYLKMIDYSGEGVRLTPRTDRVVIYTEKKDFDFLLEQIEKLQAEHPEYFEGQETSKLTGKVGEGVSVGMGMTEKQRNIAKSFSSVRSKLFENLWQEVTRELIMRYGSGQYGESKTLEGAFIETGLASRTAEGLTGSDISSALRTLPISNLSKGSSPTEELCARSLKIFASDLLRKVKSEELLSIAQEKLQVLAPLYDVDPNNLAANLSSGGVNG